MKAEQRGIQSVEVAGEILRIIVDQARPVTLSEIAELTGTAPAQIFSYLVSLVRVGLLKRHPVSQAFEPGPLSLRLGTIALHHSPQVKPAMAAANALGQRLNLNVFVAIWSHFGPIVVHFREYGAILNIGFRLGAVFSLTRTATGRLFAAFQETNRCEVMIQQQTFTRDSLDVFRSPAFQSQLAEIRQQRLSTALGYPTPSVSTLAVPVFDHQGQMVLAIGAFSAASALDDARIQAIGTQLREVAGQLSQVRGADE